MINVKAKHGAILLIHNPFNLFEPITYLGLIIRFLAKTHWNHCAIVIKKSGRFYVVESSFPCVKIAEYAEWMQAYKREIEVINIDPLSKEMHSLVERVESKIGKKYDLTALLIHMPIYLITKKWYGRKEGKGIDKPYCFEFIAWLYQFPNWFSILPNEFVKCAKNIEVD